MNWYKWAQKKTFDELIARLESDPRVGRDLIAWIKSLPRDKMGPAANMLMKNPSATQEELETALPKDRQLTPEQKSYIANFPLIQDWLKNILLRTNEKNNAEVFNTIKDQAARIRDWLDRTSLERIESIERRTGERPNTEPQEEARKIIQGMTLSEAIKQSEEWHRAQIAFEAGEYAPTKPGDIIKTYPNGWTWQRISRGVDVKIEGSKMKHCVGGYCDDVEDEKIDVFSLRDEKNRPLITAGMKVKDGSVQQMKGYNDTNVIDKYFSYIKDIIDINNVFINDGEAYIDGENMEKLGLHNISDPIDLSLPKNKKLVDVAHRKIIANGFPPQWALQWAEELLFAGNAPKEWFANLESFFKSNFIDRELRTWIDYILAAEASPKDIVQKINNIITEKAIDHIKNAPGIGFADRWFSNKIEKLMLSGNAPKEFFEIAHKEISETAIAPTWAESWAIKILNGPNPPQEWIDKIHYFMKKLPYHTPYWTNSWAKRIFSRPEGPPKDLEEAVIESVARNGTPPDYAHYWAISKLNSPNPPKGWINMINNFIKRDGTVPMFAQEWVRVKLATGNIPKEWEDKIITYTKENNAPPRFAVKWIEDSLESENPPKIIVDLINSFITSPAGVVPPFATRWVDFKLDLGDFPEEWMTKINEYIKIYGKPPQFAYNWAKRKLDSGRAPKEWIEDISKDILKGGLPSIFATDWIQKIFDSGKAPKELIEGVGRIIEKTGDVPDFAFNWASKILESGQAPKEWIEAINRSIAKTGNAPDFAESWARNILESGQAPKEWIEAIDRSIAQTGKIPYFAEKWARKMLESGQAPKKWTEAINREK